MAKSHSVSQVHHHINLTLRSLDENQYQVEDKLKEIARLMSKDTSHSQLIKQVISTVQDQSRQIDQLKTLCKFEEQLNEGLRHEWSTESAKLERLTESVKLGSVESVKPEADTLISAAHLNSVILQTIVDNIARVNRKIAIGVINETPSSWTAQCPFFKSGTSDAVLPEFVKSGEAALYSARRRHTSFLVGAVGMFTYYMPDAEKTLAVMFSVPYDYRLFDNWWNAKVYRGKKKADSGTWNELYHENPFKGDGSWCNKEIGEGYRMKGVMTGAAACTLELKIFC